MKLEDLANAVHASQNEAPRIARRILADLFTKHESDAHDIITVCCATPRNAIKGHHVVRMLAESFGLFPEEYDTLMSEDEMPSLLASESPAEVAESITVRQAIEFKEMILKGELNADILFNSMSQLCAMMFWGYAFGKTTLNMRRIMGAVATVTPYDTNHLQQMRTVMPAGEVVQRALKGSLPDEYVIQPTYPFKAPTYSRWNRWSLPFDETHYEIIRGQHYYAHRRSRRLYTYDRHGVRIARSPALPYHDDCVCEVDEAGNIVEWLHREGEPNLWKEGRHARATNPKKVEDRAHLRALVQSLEEGETLRLLDAERAYYHNGAVGGFIVPRRTFDIPLLILGGYREGEGIRIKIAALDGFDPLPVGYAYVKADEIPDKLARLYEAQGMMEIDEGIIGIFHALGYDQEEKKMRAPYLARIDTTLGQSDAMQIGDLMEK